MAVAIRFRPGGLLAVPLVSAAVANQFGGNQTLPSLMLFGVMMITCMFGVTCFMLVRKDTTPTS